jgi:hypothetical protein
VTAGTAVLAAGTLNAVNGNHNGRIAVWFQVTTAGTVTTRFGLGLPSNEGSGVSLTCSDYMIESVAAINTIPSEFVPCGLRASFNHANGNTVSSGKYIDEAEGADISQCASMGVMFHGDSFQNEITEFPFLVRAATTYGTYVNGFNGRTLQTGISQAVNNYSLQGCEFIANSGTGNSIAAPFDATTARPAIWVVELCINDLLIGVGATIAEMESRIRSYVSTLRTVFAGPLIVFDASPCSTNASWTAGKQTVIEAYNALLLTLATELGFTVFGRYALLGEAGTPEQLAAAYNSGDGLHPNSTGQSAISTALIPYIDAAYVEVSSAAGYSLGDDSNDGLSLAEPWLTETHAISNTVEGAGVTLNTGTYGAIETIEPTRFLRGATGLVPWFDDVAAEIGTPTLGSDGWETSITPDTTGDRATLGPNGWVVNEL